MSPSIRAVGFGFALVFGGCLKVPPPWGFVLLLQARVHGWAIDAWWRQVFRCIKGVVLG
jgi:hypothetical protein